MCIVTDYSMAACHSHTSRPSSLIHVCIDLHLLPKRFCADSVAINFVDSNVVLWSEAISCTKCGCLHMRRHANWPLSETAVAKCIMQILLNIAEAACNESSLSKLCFQVLEKSVVLHNSYLYVLSSRAGGVSVDHACFGLELRNRSMHL